MHFKIARWGIFGAQFGLDFFYFVQWKYLITCIWLEVTVRTWRIFRGENRLFPFCVVNLVICWCISATEHLVDRRSARRWHQVVWFRSFTAVQQGRRCRRDCWNSRLCWWVSLVNSGAGGAAISAICRMFPP